MALLIRIAQTQLGAERLLESRLFQVLAQCDYIDARPEADQSFLGKLFIQWLIPLHSLPLFSDHDSFLPSAIHRYHQLVLPTLEVANSAIATLGAASQASKPVRSSIHLLLSEL